MTSSRVAPLALATLLVLSGLALVPHPVAAQAQSLTVTTAPFFAPADDTGVCAELRARPDGSASQVRTVRVAANAGGAGALTSVTFRYELVADPGTSAQPGLGRALRWDASRSSASGWTVREDNNAVAPGGARTLIFAGGSLSTAPPGQDFTIAFTVPSSAIGDSPDPAKQDSYPISIIGTTATGATDTTQQPASLCVKVDNTPPGVAAAITRDGLQTGVATADGRIDQVEMRFTEAIDPATIVRDEFAVHNPNEATAYANFEPTKPTAADPKTMFINLAPGLSFDSGVIPTLVYPASQDRSDRPGTTTLADLAGNRLGTLAPATVRITDGAKPVLVSAFGMKDSTEVLLTFSEPVTGSGPGGSIVAADLRYSELPSADSCISDPLGTQLGSIIHPSPTADRVTVKFAAPNKLCDADVDKITEGWFLAPAENAPVACPFAEPYIDLPRTCDRVVKDAAGLTGLPYWNDAGEGSPVRNTGPRVIAQGGAEISIGSFQLALRFNGPVSGCPLTQPSCTRDDLPIALGAIDVVSADGTGEGPGGVVMIGHRAKSNQAILTLDKPVRPTDVDDTPAHIRIKCNLVKGSFIPAYIPCYDPDGDGSIDVPMVDLLPPSVLFAYTYDGDRNGYVDGIKLIFSEPVDDASFCAGSGAHALAPVKCSDTCPPGPTTTPPQCNNLLRIAGIPGPYRWDTDLRPNDAEGIVHFAELPTEPSGSIKPIITLADGLFTDLAHPYVEPSGYAYISANKMKQICREATLDCPNTVNVLDGAAPVIWRAETVDTVPLGGSEGNGRIDAFRLTFSENVVTRSFKPQEWQVEGHKVVSVRTTTRLDDPQAGQQNGTQLLVIFTENPEPDTATRPELTYSPILGGLRDLAGNPMRQVLPIDVDEQDGAPPTIVSIAGPHALVTDGSDPENSTVSGNDPTGQTMVEVTFSEPVDDGNHGSIVRRAFVYANIDQGGASGMDNTAAVRHQAGDDHATITLNAPLTSRDVAADCLGANQNSIYEVAPTVASKKPVGTTCRALVFGTDRTPPGKVQDLSVTRGVTTANSVTLTWTAPGNDGTTHGPVAGYLVKVGSETLSAATFNRTDLVKREVLATTAAATTDTSPRSVIAGPILMQFEPEVGAFAGPGTTQTVTISGLDADSDYHFMVRAFDDAEPVALYGVPSEDVLAHTGSDNTPPAPAPVISSTTHAPNKATALTNAVFSWTASRDPESTVQYRYAFNQQPGYVVTKADAPTTGLSLTKSGIATGTWTLHVAAFSAGGSSPTAHYTVVVGAAALDREDIRLANELVHDASIATRHKGSNTINWTLPPEDQLPPGATLQAVRIYRLEGGKVTMVGEVKGSYPRLRVGSFTDNSTDATDRSAYRADMVFADNQEQAKDPTQVLTGFVRVVGTDPASNTVAWLLATLLIAALAYGAAYAVIRARRNRGDTGFETPAGIDAETGLPTHDVRCPSCQTAFQAVGNLPLQIGCPKCGVSGLLQ